MPLKDTAIALLEQVINQTSDLIFDIDNDRVDSDNAINNWQLRMMGIGMLPPDFISGGSNPPDTPPTNNNEQVLQALDVVSDNIVNLITEGFVDAVDSIQRTSLNNTTAILSSINSQINRSNDVTVQATTEIIDTLENLNTSINNTISGISENQSNIVDDVVDEISTLQMDYSNDILGAINLLGDRLDDSISNLSFEGSGGGGSGEGFSFSDIEAYLIDLLGVIDTFRLDFINKDFSVDVTVNDSDGGGGSGSGSDSNASVIGGAFTGAELVAILADVLNTGISSEVGNFGERINQLNDLISRLFSNQIQDYDAFIAEFESLFGTGNVTDAILKLILVVPALLSGIISATQPFANNLETIARTRALDGLLPPDVIRELWIRQIITPEFAQEQFKKLGYKESDAGAFWKSGTVQLQDYFLREALLRDLITDEQHDDLMQKLGYQITDLPVIKKTYTRIPPIPDLIRFAVREAYNEDLARELQLDSGYDLIKERFEKDLRQNGLEEQYGQLYWRSHWDLPSPTQGYEMLHRNVIDEDELRRLLTVSDYSPEWIDKLMAISYSPYTRVDIRRMHDLGILTEQEVTRAYMDIGYTRERAENLTAFTVALNSPQEKIKDKNLSPSQILRSYRMNIITEASARQLLNDLGYANNEVEILIRLDSLQGITDEVVDTTLNNMRRIENSVSKSFIEGMMSEQSARIYLSRIGFTNQSIDQEITALRIERDIVKQTEDVNHVFKSYVEYRVSELEARSILSANGYTPVEENDILQLWRTQRDKRYSNPTKSELKRFFVAGQINEVEYLEYLYALGYDDTVAQLYVNETKLSMNDDT